MFNTKSGVMPGLTSRLSPPPPNESIEPFRYYLNDNRFGSFYYGYVKNKRTNSQSKSLNSMDMPNFESSSQPNMFSQRRKSQFQSQIIANTTGHQLAIVESQLGNITSERRRPSMTLNSRKNSATALTNQQGFQCGQKLPQEQNHIKYQPNLNLSKRENVAVSQTQRHKRLNSVNHITANIKSSLVGISTLQNSLLPKKLPELKSKITRTEKKKSFGNIFHEEDDNYEETKQEIKTPEFSSCQNSLINNMVSSKIFRDCQERQKAKESNMQNIQSMPKKLHYSSKINSYGLLQQPKNRQYNKLIEQKLEFQKQTFNKIRQSNQIINDQEHRQKQALSEKDKLLRIKFESGKTRKNQKAQLTYLRSKIGDKENSEPDVMNLVYKHKSAVNIDLAPMLNSLNCCGDQDQKETPPQINSKSYRSCLTQKKSKPNQLQFTPYIAKKKVTFVDDIQPGSSTDMVKYTDEEADFDVQFQGKHADFTGKFEYD